MVEEDWVRDHGVKLDIQKSVAPDGMRLRELVDIIVRPLSIILERSWQSGEVPEAWRKANVIHAFKRGQEAGPGQPQAH